MSPLERSVQHLTQEAQVSLAETELKELHNKLKDAYDYCFDTFFQKDTWIYRQKLCYGSLLGIVLLIPENLTDEYDWKNHNWEPEDALVKKIHEELGLRINYYEAAYYFIQILNSLCIKSRDDTLSINAKRAGCTIAEMAAENLAEIRKRLTDDAANLESFISSDNFKNAFTITIDQKNADFEIENLALDENEIRRKWQQLLGR